MVSDSKLHLVQEYLQRELSDYMILEKCVTDPETLAFVISTPSHSTLLKIRKSFVQHKNSRHLVGMLYKNGQCIPIQAASRHRRICHILRAGSYVSD